MAGFLHPGMEAGKVRASTVGASALFALCVAQGALLISDRERRQEKGGSQALRAGDTVELTGIPDGSKSGKRLSGEDGFVFLVFDPECVHCRAVIPLWREWARRRESTLRISAVTSASEETASAFLREFDWKPQIWAGEGGQISAPPLPLTRRTPWVFVLDANGIVVAEGHGRWIESLAEESAGAPGIPEDPR